MAEGGRRLAAIMFTDVVGFTARAQQDEPRALGLLRQQAEIVRATLTPHRGREVKSMGDGLLLEFPSALDAVECAVDLQRGLHERSSASGGEPFRIRIGIHVGDVQDVGTDILGDAVNIAARVESAAEPGGICLSAQVFDQVRTKVPYQLEALGPRSFKGLQRPVEVYRVALPWGDGGAGAERSSVPRLAVLPLANISADPKDEYFADGLTEELISVLSRLRGLRVIARTSVGQYKHAPKPVRQIGSELGVGAVLEGSVRMAGDRLRISLQLIDAATEEPRWAETYDRKLEDVFAIQSEVAARTAEALRLELLDPDLAAIGRGPTASTEAYELYLKGLVGFQRTADENWTLQGVQAAVACFERAIALDPGFSAAYSALANLLIGAMSETVPRATVAPRIRELVTKALELDPGSSDAHTARGNYALQVDLDWKLAETEFRTAKTLNPSNGAVCGWYAILLDALGRPAEALRELELAAGIDPFFRQFTYWQTLVRLHDREFVAAEQFTEKALQRYPGDRHLRDLHAEALLGLGRTEEARREATLAAGPTPSLRQALDHALLQARLGQPGEARRIVAASHEDLSGHYLRPNLIAALLMTLGEREPALELLERDAREGERSLWIDFRRVDFDPVRGDPRFLALLEGMHLPTQVGPSGGRPS